MRQECQRICGIGKEIKDESGGLIVNLFGGAEMSRLKGAITAAELRQQVISDNIANVDTPGFKRSEVLFEEILAQRMSDLGPAKVAAKRTNAKHIAFGQGGTTVKPQFVTDSTSVMNNNVNNVDIDREMALLAKNQLRYNALIQHLNHEISMLRTAMEGR